jgi:imidazoleglycerol-phosphate dehydratase/histidinol-phosphatase
MNVIFLDRDGTIIVEPSDEQIDTLEKLEMIPGAIQGLRLLQNRGYVLVMVTNQDNLGSAAYTQKSYDLVQNKLMGLLNGEGIQFAAVFVCPHNSKDNCTCRKPKVGLVSEFMRTNNVDLARSYVFGDRETDVKLAQNIGCKSIRLTTEASSKADFKTESFMEACTFILRQARSASVKRKTLETNISIEVCLDGTGSHDVSSGIGFFDHMLSLLSKHSGIDMNILVKGDLQVDEHHSVEDTGLALGEAIRQALGDKRGIERYGFLLSMHCLSEKKLASSQQNW